MKKNIIPKLILLALLVLTIFSIKDKFVVYGSGDSAPTSHVSWVKGSLKTAATCTNKAVYYCK